MLEELKNKKKTVGIKQSVKAIEGGQAQKVIIARDAEERIVINIKDLCSRNSIEVAYVENMKNLGKACGIEVGAAVVCLLK